jgi:hypothetical protein
VRDPHRLIIGEIQKQPVSDLLWAPGLRPPSVLSGAVTPAGPPHIRASHRGSVRPFDGTRETILRIAVKLRVDRELRGLRPLGATVGVPLRGAGPALQITTTGASITTKLPGDRGSRAAELARDLSNPTPTGTLNRDLLTLGERQVTPRQRGLSD